MENIELRFVDFTVMTNQNSEDLTVTGYVNEVGKYSHTLGIRKKFRERIMPGTFERALSSDDDIHFLAEHDSQKILASTRNGSLQLKEDEKGLLMTAKISPTSYGKDYYTLIKDGILRNMSFGFNVLKDKWKKLNDGTYTRDITDLKLFEVSVVTNPAYPQSTISARGLNLVEDVEIPDDVEEKENMENKIEEVIETSQVEDNEIQEKEEVIEKTEQVDEIEVEKTEEVKKETQEEKRAYISGMYDDHDVMNSCLNIVAECMALANFFNQKGNKPELVKPFKDFAKTCNDIMLNQVEEPQPKEEASPTEGKNEEVSQEVENRSVDMTELYDMLKQIERKGE